MNPLKPAFPAVVVVLAAVQPASAAETYAYRLIPENTHLIYTQRVDAGYIQILASVSGRIGFEVHDDGTIATSAFDLTIEGPLTDVLRQPVDDAFFAPGDKLADYLTIDFAQAAGVAPPRRFWNGAIMSTAAYVGPDVSVDGGSVELGDAFYTVDGLEYDPTWLTVQAPALPQFGGWFSVQSHTEPASSGGEVQAPGISMIPNLQRVPEPRAAAQLAVALLGFALGARRRA